MTESLEHQAQQIVDQLLARAPAERDAWLSTQHLDAALLGRVHQLMAASTAPEPTRVLHAATVFASTDQAAPSPDIAGERLGPWRLLQTLGEGGMGVVYLAERADDTYEQHVAIKLVRSRAAENDPELRAQLVERFENERRLLARIEHPNIVRIIDGGSTTQGIPYLVMDYIDGPGLLLHCAGKNLDVNQRVQLIAKVCDGVQAAHRHLIVHRDLKPQNVLVGEDGEPRVLDFGIARLLDDAAGHGETETVLFAMTPAYASPEQVRHEPLTTASDVYSLGVILYELLTGTRPYKLEGLSPAQIERQISSTEPTTLRRALVDAPLLQDQRKLRAAGINSDLERIVAKALHKDPERRYDTAQALADDLRRFLRGLPVDAHPDSFGYRMRRFVGRNRLLTTAAMLTLVAILAGSGAALWQATKARQSAENTAAVNDFLMQILEDANPYESDRELTLSEAVDRAAKRIDTVFDNQPKLAATVRLSIAESMLARYQIDQGEREFQRVSKDVETLFGRNSFEAIRVQAGLGNILLEQGHDEDAQSYFTDALARLDRSENSRSPFRATYLNSLGIISVNLGDFDTAESLFTDSLRAGDNAVPPITAEDRARTLTNLAQAAKQKGELERADRLYLQAQAVLSKLAPSGSPDLALLLNNRAMLASWRDDDEQAIQLQTQAVEMFQRSFDKDNGLTANAMSNLSRTAANAGQVDLAVDWAEKSAAMAERLYPNEPHPIKGNTLLSLALAKLYQRDPEASATLIRQGTAMFDNLPARNDGTYEYITALWRQLCKNFPATDANDCKSTLSPPVE